MCSAVARPSLTQILISHADSSRPVDWQLVILLAMLYVSTITPYEVTVMDSTPLWLRVLNYGFDFIFFIDMSLQFFQGYHDADLKQMVYDPYLICRQYVSTWFVIDFLSIFPFDDVLKVVSGDRGKGTDGTQFLRLVKLARLAKLVIIRIPHLKCLLSTLSRAQKRCVATSVEQVAAGSGRVERVRARSLEEGAIVRDGDARSDRSRADGVLEYSF